MKFWLPALVALAVVPAAAHHPFTPHYDISKPAHRPLGVRRNPAERVAEISEGLRGTAETRHTTHDLGMGGERSHREGVLRTGDHICRWFKDGLWIDAGE
jgi:hypothetical protein